MEMCFNYFFFFCGSLPSDIRTNTNTVLSSFSFTVSLSSFSPVSGPSLLGRFDMDFFQPRRLINNYLVLMADA